MCNAFGDVFAADYTIFRQRKIVFLDYCHDHSIAISFGHYARIKEEVLAICRMVGRDRERELYGSCTIVCVWTASSCARIFLIRFWDAQRVTCKYVSSTRFAWICSRRWKLYFMSVRSARRIFSYIRSNFYRRRMMNILLDTSWNQFMQFSIGYFHFKRNFRISNEEHRFV